MNPRIKQHLEKVVHHLYINPLEKCNLRCAICYTKKTSPILPKERIEAFVDSYDAVHKVETITFCGGEVFTLPYFTELVNAMTARGIFVQIITNGTIDKLDQLTHPNRVNLIVSIDGMKEYHDKNRGLGNFDKSLAFLQKAHALGFHSELFSIVTHQNYEHLDAFEKDMVDRLGHPIAVTYHPRKPPAYLTHHPVSNIVGKVEGFDFLTREEMVSMMKRHNVFPPKDLGCYQIAVTSDGKVFGCCEGTIPLGTIDDSVPHLVDGLTKRLEQWEKVKNGINCLGCSQPDFVCGIKEYLLLTA
jgi:MoaA/NifB/PqqE/SkfB family radical SAM enzyme